MKTVPKLTKEQRAHCYLQAAIAIMTEPIPFCCTRVASEYCSLTGDYGARDNEDFLKPLFPELFMFKPDILPNENSMFYVTDGWWPYSMSSCPPQVREEKIMVLLFAHAIALNP